jgi:hypothetical protein
MHRLFKHKQRLRKLGHESRYPVCKTEVNWITRTISRKTQRKILQRTKAKANFEVVPEAIWPIAKSLIKRDVSQAPTAIHGP